MWAFLLHIVRILQSRIRSVNFDQVLTSYLIAMYTASVLIRVVCRSSPDFVLRLATGIHLEELREKGILLCSKLDFGCQWTTPFPSKSESHSLAVTQASYLFKLQ